MSGFRAVSATPTAGDLIKGSNSSPFAIAYEQRRMGRRFSKGIHKSVSLCGTGSGTLRVYENDDGESRSTIAAKHNCHSSWACPVCSPKLAVARSKILAPQVSELLNRGYSAHLVTLTLRHDRGDDLASMFDAMGRAWTKLSSGKAWKKWRNPINLNKAEYVKGMDLTWSLRNGWHPHLHIALYLPPEHDQDIEWFVTRWMSCLRAEGFDALRSAQDISSVNRLSTVEEVQSAQTITAYAAMTAQMPTAEAISVALKKSRKDGSFTPFEILAKANNGDRYFVILWRKYVAATKGRRQVTTSRGLRLSPDEELDLGVDDVALLGQKTRQEIEGTHLETELFKAASSCSIQERRCAVALVLLKCRADDWSIIPPPPD